MPLDIQTAMRHALRLERAKRILQEGYTFSVDADIETVYVCKPGRLFAHYLIHKGACDCPDFAEHGDLCKHTLAYGLRQEEDRQMDEAAAQYAEGIANAEDPEWGCFPF